MTRDQFNPPQQRAIDHGEGPLMVLAGPGSGKTRCLVHRIARLVEDVGIPPYAILAVTFTNKAAGEMRERLVALIGAQQAEAMWIGTFHSIAARLLRKHGEAVSLPRDFQILDDDDQRRIVKRALIDLEVPPTEVRASLRPVLELIDRAKNEGREPEVPDDGDPMRTLAARVYPLYQEALFAQGSCDFNDLLLLARRLIQHPEVGPALRARFAHVLVDEFQDTNAIQYEIVRALAARTGNLCVICDDDQVLYQWRGADPRNLMEFSRVNKRTTTIRLEQNYRSTRTIVDAAAALINVNRERHAKRLWTEAGVGTPITVSGFPDERAEAGGIAACIRALVDGRAHSVTGGPSAERYSVQQIAILYRTNQQSRALEEALRRARVPVKIVGALSFFDRKEIKDAIAYLRILDNDKADAALERIINVPPRGIGEATVEKLRAHAKRINASILTAAREHFVVTGASARAVESFLYLYDELRQLVEHGAALPEIIAQIVERTGLRERLAASDDAKDRFDALGDLISIAHEYAKDVAAEAKRRPIEVEPGSTGAEAKRRLTEVEPGSTGSTALELARAATRATGEAKRSGLATASSTSFDPAGMDAAPHVPRPTIGGFLERLALSSSADDPATPGAQSKAPAVSLMTIHIAKGLEWPVVFVAGLEEGLFPSAIKRASSGPQADANQVRADEIARVEEERRLAYVAITRARERLYLTHARTRMIWGDVSFQQPSRFLDEIGVAP